jgi:hypothetical protein
MDQRRPDVFIQPVALSSLRRMCHITSKTWTPWTPNGWLMMVHERPLPDTGFFDNSQTKISESIARILGYGGIMNVFLRVSKKDSYNIPIPIQKIGDSWIDMAARHCKVRVACWGQREDLQDKAESIYYNLRPMKCLIQSSEEGFPITVQDANRWLKGDLSKLRLSDFWVPIKRQD